APARGGRGGDGHQVASLELGPAAEERLCTGYGTLPVVSAWGAADHRFHYTGRGDLEDPPASEARSRPTPDGPGARPPGNPPPVPRRTAPRASRPAPDQCHGEGLRRRLLLRLTSPRTRHV